MFIKICLNNNCLLVILFVFSFFLSIVGCDADTQTMVATSIPEIVLEKYTTSTPTTAININSLNEVPQEPTPHPTNTPTPVVYNVVQNDTLTSIANRYGVKVNDLIAVNPGIDPNFLTIGISITIPITGNISTLDPTPIPLDFDPPNCYLDSSGGTWCLSVVSNNQPFDVENISAQVKLVSPNREISIIQEAMSPIYILPSGKSTILATYFPPPLPDPFEAQIMFNTVLPVEKLSQRYLDLSIFNSSIIISEDQLWAEVGGEFSLPNENQETKYVWIAAFAYDASGNPIGFRKWSSNQTLRSGESQRFNFLVYSLGPPISNVEILFEAKP
jgi:LysM repeat protein